MISWALLLLLTFPAMAQFDNQIPREFYLDDLVVGGDIFDDFNENVDDEDILEDERFLRYGRFFALNLGLGLTGFTGNRGLAYSNYPPTLNLSTMAFVNFRISFLLGLTYSKHSMFFSSAVEKDPDIPLGQIEVNMFRSYLGFRYYIDTSDLNTALTYSNPYFTMRLEYWLLNNTFIDREDIADDTGGGIGSSIGGGLEFPIKLKQAYINYEFLIHTVNFHDRLTNDYQVAYKDLSGLGVTNVISYVISW